MAVDFLLENRQDFLNVSDTFYIFIAALGAFIGQLISVSLGKWYKKVRTAIILLRHTVVSGFTSASRYKLENDPMCGITTGGSDDCFWNCKIEQIGPDNRPFITPPECLLECFPEVCSTHKLLK